MANFDKSKLDVSAIFLTFMALVGDVERTALAFNLDESVVQRLADEEGWSEKIRRVSLMSKSGSPGDFQRAQNRALNFVQAHQIRTLVGNMVKHLLDMDLEEFQAAVSSTDKYGKPHISARVLTDLVTAAEACQRMSYNALGDTVTERLEAGNPEDRAASTNDVHSAIIAALSNPSIAANSQKLLSEEAEQVVKDQTSPPK